MGFGLAQEIEKPEPVAQAGAWSHDFVDVPRCSFLFHAVLQLVADHDGADICACDSMQELLALTRKPKC
jgi:hypothetical protein